MKTTPSSRLHAHRASRRHRHHRRAGLGIAFPVFQSVQNQAKKTQAKNDVTQIVTAVNAFYTEYGKYPLPPTANSDATATYGSANSNRVLFDELRAVVNALNTRQIVFLSPSDAKDATNPRSGIAGTTSAQAGQYFDPWGTPYSISIDWDYDNQVVIPYGADNGGRRKSVARALSPGRLAKICNLARTESLPTLTTTLFPGNDQERFNMPRLTFPPSSFIPHPSHRGCSSMVERQLPKLDTRVRFPSPALS